MFTSAYEIYVAALTTALMMVVLVAIIVIAIVKYQRRYRLHMEEVYLLKQTYQEEILKTQLEISEETLHKISNEIHDNIGQVLALVKLNLFTLNLDEKEKAAEKVGQAKEMVIQVIKNLRDLSHLLSPEYLSKYGLTEWITHEIDVVRKSSSLEIIFKQEGTEPPIEAQRRLILIRIFQEAISNILKHSKATRVGIYLTLEKNICLVIEDNGIGFEDFGKHEGLGLSNMKSRCKILGGLLHIQSSPGKGTKINIQVPYEF